MRRIAVAAIAVLSFALSPVTGFAGPLGAKSVATANPSVVFVQGWWEQEHQERAAREGYWRLRPPELDRYNRLQIEINQLQQQRREIDERIRRAQQQQHELLGLRVDRSRR